MLGCLGGRPFSSLIDACQRVERVDSSGRLAGFLGRDGEAVQDQRVDSQDQRVARVHRNRDQQGSDLLTGTTGALGPGLLTYAYTYHDHLIFFLRERQKKCTRCTRSQVRGMLIFNLCTR